MKGTQWIDALRNIRQLRASFISICVISFLAVNAYLGIAYASEDMHREFSDYYKRRAFWDLEVSATGLLSPEDLEQIRLLSGVAAAEGALQLSAFVSAGGDVLEVSAVSLTEQLAVPELLSGQLPTRRGECALERYLAEKLGLSVGDTLTVADRDGGLAQGLRQSSFRVTAIVHHPDHLSYGVTFTPYILLPRAAFDETLTGGCFSKALIRVENAPTDRFSDAYAAGVSSVRQLLEDLAPVRCTLRDEQLRSAAQAAAALYGSDGQEAIRLYSGQPCRWIVLTNRENAGFQNAAQNAGNLSTISLTFSLLFVVVAILVIYSCTARMVEEQGRIVGSLKADGLFNREIIGKYLFFGLSAGLIGAVLGVVTASLVFQRAILLVYGGYFVCGLSKLVFLPLPALAAVLVIPGMAAAAALLACTKLLRASALSLLVGAISFRRRKARKEPSGRALLPRLVLLNMQTSFKRVLVTAVSVMGCCTLLMIGFTLYFSIIRVPGRQYGEIQTYDMIARFDPSRSERAGTEIAATLTRAGAQTLSVHSEDLIFRAGGKQNLCTVICASPDALRGWFNALDTHNGVPVALPRSGLLVGIRFAEHYGVSPGESFTLCDSSLLGHEAKVSGLFNNYLYEMVLCSPDAWAEIFGQEAVNNCLLIRSGGAPARELLGLISQIDGFQSLESAEGGRDMFESLAGTFTYIALLFIVMAGLMAWFILMNLSDVYMLQKTPELAVMRINGFMVRECLVYAAAEPIVTSAAGIVSGIALGGVMGGAIVRMLEQSGTQFARDMDWRTPVLSALITAVFALLINGLSLRKIRTLRLSQIR